MQNVTCRLSDTPGQIKWAGHPIGQDNEEVLGLTQKRDETQRNKETKTNQKVEKTFDPLFLCPFVMSSFCFCVSPVKDTQGAGGINTAFIERLNGAFRSCLGSLARRTRTLGRKAERLAAGAFLVGTVYNFCTEHASLRLPGLLGGHKWLGRTPALASGLTDHCWSVKELLNYRVSPPPWQPPKRRGRPSQALKALIARWG